MYQSSFLLVVLFGVTLSTAQNSTFRIDPSVDFSKFKTYAWDQSTNTQPVTNQVDAQVIETLEAELGRKDLRKTDSNAANLLICYHSNFGTETVKRYTIKEGESSYGWTVKTSQLAIDMFDSSSKKLIWHNVAELNPKAKPQHVAKAVSNLLKNYPPKNK